MEENEGEQEDEENDPTGPITILERKNRAIGEFYAVQERRAACFAAQKL